MNKRNGASGYPWYPRIKGNIPQNGGTMQEQEKPRYAVRYEHDGYPMLMGYYWDELSEALWLARECNGSVEDLVFGEIIFDATGIVFPYR